MTDAQLADAQIRTRLRRAKRGLTAKALGTTTKRLQRIDGVAVIGVERTGGRGRPALLFGMEDSA